MEQSFDEFYKQKGGRDGLLARCKSCCRIERRSPERKASNEKYKRSSKGRATEQRYLESKGRETQRAYRKANQEKLSVQQSFWRAANSDKVKAYREDYYKTPKGRAVILAAGHRRRSRKLAADGNFTSGEWLELCEKCDYTCLRCRKKGLELTMDHVIPLSKGGSNWISNIQPLCGLCNSIKGTKSIDYRPS